MRREWEGEGGVVEGEGGGGGGRGGGGEGKKGEGEGEGQTARPFIYTRNFFQFTKLVSKKTVGKGEGEGGGEGRGEGQGQGQGQGQGGGEEEGEGRFPNFPVPSHVLGLMSPTSHSIVRLFVDW